MKIKLVELMKQLTIEGKLDLFEDSFILQIVMDIIEDLNNREMAKTILEFIEALIEPIRKANENVEIVLEGRKDNDPP